MKEKAVIGFGMFNSLVRQIRGSGVGEDREGVSGGGKDDDLTIIVALVSADEAEISANK